MIFLNPFLLVGALAAGIPLVIHLFYTRKAQQIVFSTLMFLKMSHRRTAHRKRLRDVLLLLFRMLLVTLFAIGLSKPTLRSAASLLGGGDVDAALVIDNSYSMATEDGGVPRFKTAKDLARQYLDRLPPSSRAALVFAAREETARDGGPARDLGAARDALAACEPRARRGSLSAAVARAYDALRRARTSGGPNTEVVVFSDLQANSLRDPLPERPDPRTAVLIADCAADDFKNLGLVDLSLHGTSLVAGAPVTLSATVHNDNSIPQSALLRVFVDGVQTSARVVEVPPYASQPAAFSIVFDRPGSHSGYAALAPDSLAFDNERYFTVDVRAAIPVLVVEEAPGAVDFLNDSYYISRALDPFSALGMPEKSAIRPVVERAETAFAGKLDRVPVVFLVNVGTVPPPAAEALCAYVRQGGALVVLPGDLATPERLNALDPEGAEPFLPARIEGAENLQDKFRALQEINVKEPVFEQFQGIEDSVLAQAHAFQFLRVKPRERAVVLAKLDGDAPLIVMGHYGLGRVVFFTTGVNLKWSNLPATNMFLPLIHRLTTFLSRSDPRGNSVPVDAPVELAPESGQTGDALVTDPAGRETVVKPSPQGRTVFAQTSQRGIYSYRFGSGEKRCFAVNVDPEESNPERLKPEAVKALFGEKHLYWVKTADDLDRTLARLRKGVGLWNLLLAIVLAMAVVETLLANAFTAKPQEQARKGQGEA